MKNTFLLISIYLFLFFASQNLFSQEVYTEFTNPSFEDIPRPQHPPQFWWDCGFFKQETPVDIHPALPEGIFKVTRPPYHGETYLGMVVRENGSYESVSQELKRPLEANQCYSFSVFMSTSPTYISSIRGKEGEVNFSTPVFLRVWGGSGFCDLKESLAVSDLVNHTSWQEYHFQFSPKNEIKYLLFEVFYHEEFEAPNGHILIDNLSPIYALACEDMNPALVREKPEISPIEYLEKVIMRDGEEIYFNSKNKLSKTSKKSISNIVESLLAVEDVKLVLRIRGRKEAKVQARIEALNAAFEKFDLDKKRYSVRKYERSQLPKNNYWYSENKDVFIGLQLIK